MNENKNLYTLKEFKDLKKRLEESILDAIIQFEKMTDTEVSALYFEQDFDLEKEEFIKILQVTTL